MTFIDKLLSRFRTPDTRDAAVERMSANSRSTLERVVRLENPQLTDREIRVKVLDAIVDARTARLHNRRATDG